MWEGKGVWWGLLEGKSVGEACGTVSRWGGACGRVGRWVGLVVV